jgi:hypothetical protein
MFLQPYAKSAEAYRLTTLRLDIYRSLICADFLSINPRPRLRTVMSSIQAIRFDGGQERIHAFALQATMRWVPPVPNTYYFPVQRQGSSGPGTARYVGAQSLRIWFAPGKQIQGAVSCDSGAPI